MLKLTVTRQWLEDLAVFGLHVSLSLSLFPSRSISMHVSPDGRMDVLYLKRMEEGFTHS